MRIATGTLMAIFLAGTTALGADTLTYSESYTESVKKIEGEYDVVGRSKTTIKGKVDLGAQGLTPSDVWYDTEWEIGLGNISLSGELGEDPKAMIGPDGGKAAFPILDDDDNVAGVLRLSWNKAMILSFQIVNAKVGALADNYVGDDGGVVETEVAEVILAEAGTEFEVRVTGTAKTTTKVVGKGDDAEEFDLSKVNLKGTGKPLDILWGDTEAQ